MGKLSGKISDRIRSGKIPPEALTGKRPPTDDRPHPSAVRHGSGRALGAGHLRDGTNGTGIRED